MTTADLNADQLREGQRRQWAAAAPGWRRHRDELRRATRPITERMIALGRLRGGLHILDLACGLGDPAIAAAGIVGPSGHVVGLDISEPMIAGARSWAAEHEVANVDFREIASELDPGVDIESFDRATCRAGLACMPDPTAALAELYRALAPGGRCVAGSWGPPERLQAASVPMEILKRHLDLPEPSTDGPGPSAIPTEERLRSHFEDAGFNEIETVAFEVNVIDATTPERAWQMLATIDGDTALTLEAVSEADRATIDADAVRTLGELFPDGRVRLGGEHLLAVGAKA